LAERLRRSIHDAIGQVRRTPAGVLIVPASLSRTGLQEYKRSDGSTVTELRPEAEVFADAALQSVRGAAVTVGHTLERTPKAVGLASDQPPTKAQRGDESFVETTLLITDQDVISRIELPPGDPRRLTEISLDYYAELDPTPGEYRGRKYDARQTNIIVHSVALGPSNWARAGREAKIRLDGNEELCNETDSAAPSENANAAPEQRMKIKIGDHVFEEGSAEHIAFLNAEIKREQARADALQVSLTAAQNATATEKARADGLAAKPEPDVNALVAAELAFRDSVRTLLAKDYSFAGKSRAQVQRDAIGAEACSRVDAQPEPLRAAYLDGALAFALSQGQKPSYPVPGSAPVQDANKDFLSKLDAGYKAQRAGSK
jgi:hypothetical protein